MLRHLILGDLDTLDTLDYNRFAICGMEHSQPFNKRGELLAKSFYNFVYEAACVYLLYFV